MSLLFIVMILFCISCGSEDEKKSSKRKIEAPGELTLLTQEEREERKAIKTNIKERRTISYFYNKSYDLIMPMTNTLPVYYPSIPYENYGANNKVTV